MGLLMLCRLAAAHRVVPVLVALAVQANLIYTQHTR
jgi:hypothetical protein